MCDAVIPEGWSAWSLNFPRIAEGDGVYRKVGSSSENQQGNQSVGGEQITVINPRRRENSPMIPQRRPRAETGDLRLGSAASLFLYQAYLSKF